MFAEPLRTRAIQPAKSGSSCAMKSVKPFTRSSGVVGSSAIWISRVNGSSSTTMTGLLTSGQPFAGSTSTRSAVNTRLCMM